MISSGNSSTAPSTKESYTHPNRHMIGHNFIEGNTFEWASIRPHFTAFLQIEMLRCCGPIHSIQFHSVAIHCTQPYVLARCCECRLTEAIFIANILPSCSPCYGSFAFRRTPKKANESECEKAACNEKWIRILCT